MFNFKREGRSLLFTKVVIKDLRLFPCKNPNYNTNKKKGLVDLVKLMLNLQKKKQELLLFYQRERVEHEIAQTNEKIDKLVYELYGITEHERKIIEPVGIQTP